MAAGGIPREVGEYKIEIDVVLGSGTDATVYLAIHVPSETRMAVKVIPTASNQQRRERAMMEVHLLRQLSRHEYVIGFFDVIDTVAFVFLFLEYAPYGDLGSFIHRHGRLEEELARKFFVQILSALDHCHSNNIAHHDLKLENMLLAADYTLRLIDFGLSRRFGKEAMITEYAGSPLYMPPEILALQPHDQQIDVWSLGVCLYYMVTDLFPFPAETYHELEEKVLFDDVVFPQKMGLTDPLQDLLRSMLHKDPKQRISVALIRKHPWIIKSYASSSMSKIGTHHSHHHHHYLHRGNNGHDHWPPDSGRDPPTSPR